MRGVVLVGGQGTRLRPLTLTTPKQMLPVAGRPMIERVLGHLAAQGVGAVVLALGYRPEPFMAAYPDGICAGVRLAYAVEGEPLDTAGAVAFAARSVGIDEPFVVVNGDVLTDLDIAALAALHHDRSAEATIALTAVADPSAFGVVPTDESGRVTSFVEKPPPGQAPTNLINAGTYVLDPAILERIPVGGRVSIERELFPALVADGSLYALASDASWIDAGTPATYLQANLEAAAAEGGVHPTATIAAGAHVTDSVLGAGVRVADGAKVERSVLFDGVEVASEVTVTRAIVGYRSRLAAGAVVAAGDVIGDDADVASALP